MQKNNRKDIIDELLELFIKIVSDFIAHLLSFVMESMQPKTSKDSIEECDTQIKDSTITDSALGYDILNNKNLNYQDYNTDKSLSLITGPPGVGKTVLMQNIIDLELTRGVPFILIDPKASLSSKEEFSRLGKVHNRETLILEIGSTLRFNPLKGLTPTQITSALAKCFPNDHSYYGPRSSYLLQSIVKDLYEDDQTIDFHTILSGLETKSKRSKNFENDIQGIFSNIKLLCDSEFGQIFRDTGSALSIDDIRIRGVNLYIALPSLAYNQISSSVGKVIITSIMTHAFKSMNTTDFKDDFNNLGKISLFVDEAASFVFEGFETLPAQCREAKINITLATQSISDFKKINNAFFNQLITYSANLWAFRTPSAEDAEVLSALFGTKSEEKRTIQVEGDNETGLGSLRETEKYRVHPNILKKLPNYQAVLKFNNNQISLINIRDISKVVKHVETPLNKFKQPKQVQIPRRRHEYYRKRH